MSVVQKAGPLLVMAGMVMLYVPGSLLAIALGNMTGMAAVFFPPAGLTVAALIRLPRRYWPAILAGAFLAELGTDIASGLGPVASLGFATANSAEPLVGAILTSALCRGDLDLTRRRHAAAFVVGAAIVAPFVGAFVGALTDWVVNSGGLISTFWQWWLGDSLGVLVIGAALLALGSGPDRRSMSSPEGVLLLAMTAVAMVLTVNRTDLPLEFLVILASVVAGTMFGTRSVTLVALVSVATLAFGLIVETGPLWRGVPDATALAVIKAELVVIQITGLLVAAEVIESHRAALAGAKATTLAELATEREAFARRVLDSLSSFGWVLTPEGTLVETNRTPLEAAGLTLDEVAGKRLWDCPWWSHDADEQTRLQEAVGKAATGETVRYDTAIRVADGERVWIDLQVAPLWNDAGEVSWVIPSGVDLTSRKAAELQRQRSLAVEQAARRRFELLERNARHLAAAATVDELAASVLSDLQITFGIERGRILVVVPDGFRVAAEIAGGSSTMSDGDTVPEDIRVPGALAIRNNATVSIDDPAEISDRFPDLTWSPRPSECIMAIPLRTAAGAVLGAVEIWSESTNERLVDNQDVLSSVAYQTGQALERATLYQQVVDSRDREHDVALRLQLALLPESVVNHPHVSIAAHYEAAGDLMAVGGDWYDTFTWSSGHIGLLLGDVCGHDLDATIAMGRLRAAMAATAPLCHPDPVAVMDALDQLAWNQDDVPFATATCFVLDPATGYLRYTNAGHPPPLVVNPDRSTVWLEGGHTPPIASIPIDERARAEFQLERGSILVLYSDGLVERRDESLDVGLERLAEAASRAAGAGLEPDAFLRNLLVELNNSDNLEDDTIVLCARWDLPPF